MDPHQQKSPLSNRGAALWGNLVISTANYPARVIATDKETGKMVWESNLSDQPDVQLTAAPLVVKDKIIMGAAGGDRGVRDWIAGLDAATGKPVPMFDPTYRPGDNLYTNSVISWNPDAGKMNWYFQYTPGDQWDYDEAGTHILVDGQINGEPRKVITLGAQRVPLHDGAQQRADHFCQ